EVQATVAVSPTLPHQLIAYRDPPGRKVEIIKSRYAGDSWETRSENPPTESSPVSLTIDPRYANTAYLCTWFFWAVGELASTGDVYKTDDGGRTWKKLKEGPAYVQAFVSFAAPETVYVLAHDVEFGVGRWSHIYRSNDGGARWRKVPLPDVLESKQEWIQEMEVSPHQPDVLYVATNQFQFFELTVDGEWVEKSQGLPPRPDFKGPIASGVVSFVPDPKIPDRLYAAMITGDGKHPHSVYVKPDADSPWQTYSSGLEAVEVNDLSIDPVNLMLYAATTAGIYVTPLYSEPEQPNPQPAIAESRLFQNYPNPLDESTHIPYQLLQPGRVTLDIHNVFGRLVHSIKLGAQAEGRYVLPDRAAPWNGRNASGEKVAGGIYFYTLKVNGQSVDTRRMAVMRK
ncbi:MAG: hypothetical protein O7E52_02455, partial [Candidatus Poribacteria bacterium]|nr:hypothetical protein [Candidatus Poribacteria bacterium]